MDDATRVAMTFHEFRVAFRLSRGQRERTRSALRDARVLSVDQRPLLSDGLLLFAAGRGEQDIAIAERVVGEEPDNLEGWTALAFTFSMTGQDKRVAYVARRVPPITPLRGGHLG